LVDDVSEVDDCGFSVMDDDGFPEKDAGFSGVLNAAAVGGTKSPSIVEVVKHIRYSKQ